MAFFTENVINSTQNYIMPTVFDQKLDSNVLVGMLLNPKKLKKFRGITHDIPLSLTGSNSRGSSFRGTDTFKTDVEDFVKNLVFNPKWYQEPLNLIGTDVSINQNSTEEQAFDLVLMLTETAMSGLMDALGDQFYGSGDDTSKDFSGLQSIVSATGSIGGLSRTTFPVLKPGGSAGAGLDSTTTTLTLAAMRTVVDALTSGSIKPNFAIGSEALYAIFEALIPVTNQLNLNALPQVTRDGLVKNQIAITGQAGFNALSFDGIPVVRDEKATANALYFLNMNYLAFHSMVKPIALPGWSHVQFNPKLIEGQYTENVMPGHKTPLMWSGFKEPTNQATEISQIVIGGELISMLPKYQGGFTAITG